MCKIMILCAEQLILNKIKKEKKGEGNKYTLYDRFFVQQLLPVTFFNTNDERAKQGALSSFHCITSFHC